MTVAPLRYVVAAITLGALACSTPTPAALAPAPTEAASAAPATSPEPSAQPAISEPAPAPRALPSACVAGPVCTPPTDFATRLCGGTHPEVALHMFAPKTPWKRAYVKRSFQAWYVGGHGDMRELRASEEVLIVNASRGTATGQGMGGQPFDVFRWDGTCVSLMEDELSFKKPEGVVPANIVWKKLEPAFRAVFAEEKGIDAMRAVQDRICDAPTAEKEPGKSKCEMARRQLSLAISQSVGRGKALPELSSIP